MELSEYVVDFEKRSAIKSHILAEWMEPESHKHGHQTRVAMARLL
jgi:hypothetical protein